MHAQQPFAGTLGLFLLFLDELACTMRCTIVIEAHEVGV